MVLQQLTRRRLLQGAGTGAALAIVGPCSGYVLDARSSPAIGCYPHLVLAAICGNEEARNLVRLIDVIIPSSGELPSGSQAHVPDYVGDKLARYCLSDKPAR